jgi:hypothetical protein
VANGEPMLPRADRVRYQEAVADLRQHYATTGARGLDESEGRLKHLDAFFTGYRLAAIGPALSRATSAQRQGRADAADRRAARARQSPGG